MKIKLHKTGQVQIFADNKKERRTLANVFEHIIGKNLKFSGYLGRGSSMENFEIETMSFLAIERVSPSENGYYLRGLEEGSRRAIRDAIKTWLDAILRRFFRRTHD